MSFLASPPSSLCVSNKTYWGPHSRNLVFHPVTRRCSRSVSPHTAKHGLGVIPQAGPFSKVYKQLFPPSGSIKSSISFPTVSHLATSPNLFPTLVGLASFFYQDARSHTIPQHTTHGRTQISHSIPTRSVILNLAARCPRTDTHSALILQIPRSDAVSQLATHEPTPTRRSNTLPVYSPVVSPNATRDQIHTRNMSQQLNRESSHSN